MESPPEEAQTRSASEETSPSPPPSANSFIASLIDASSTDTRVQGVRLAAREFVREYLSQYGSTLSADHQTALDSVLSVYTLVAASLAEADRYAVALPTGTGKTQSAVAFIAAIVQQGLPWSVAVCAERVEQLIDFRKELLRRAVPEEQIGLWYAEGREYSVPRTEHAESKQFLLLTHSRVRGGAKVEQFFYKGKQRNLVIYDESLIASNHTAFELSDLDAAVAWLDRIAQNLYIPKTKRVRAARADKATLQDLVGYLLTTCLPVLMKERDIQEAGSKPSLVRFEDIPPQMDEWKRAMDRRLYKSKHQGEKATIRSFLRMVGRPIRIVTTTSSVLVTASVAVPESLKHVVVLDASYPIRLLENMDSGLTYITDYEGIKQYHNVHVTIEAGSSGRGATTASETTTKESPSEWAARMARDKVPAGEPVLMLTFKDRPGDVEDDDDAPSRRGRHRRSGEETIQGRFQQGARAVGLDLDRFSYLTFGMETSSADHQHNENVIFLGLLHRADVDLTGAFIGQAGDMTAPITAKDIATAKLTEIVHHVYQGLSRGSCRRIENGEAKPMRVWIRYRNPFALKKALAPVLPGVTWHLPDPPLPVVAPVVDEVVERIAAVLREELRDLISVRTLKTIVDPEGIIPGKSWQRGVTKTIASPTLSLGGSWIRERSSLRRIFYPTKGPITV